MAPNSEESRFGQFPFSEDGANKEKQRPPIYNPEDYVISLKKWGRKPASGSSVSLYPTPMSSDSECSRSQSTTFRDYRNPMLISSGSEMTLRQFGTVSELLGKLKSDLRLAYPSFVQEFVAEPLDGITLLLDLLRAIQLSQSQGGHNTTGKIPPSLQRRALLDELSCLQCLLLCCQRYTESIRKLTASSAGLFTLAICIMSNVTKSRILALQLLTKACQPSHSAVSEALSTLRLRFGEPVRFRFLVGMLMSAGGQGELLVAGMKFLNTFLDSSGTTQKRLYIQAELEQAGFDVATVKKNISINSSSTEHLFEELDHWEKKHLDVESLMIRLESSERENDTLRDKVLLLERRVQILLEEKGILISLEQCLKERCSELQEEVHSLKSVKSSSCGSSKKKDESPHEDEGISSSERSLTPEEPLQRDASVYELYTIQNEKKPPKIDEEDETTIDEVIEELRNIINDAESEAYKADEKKKALERKKIEDAQVASKIQMTVAIEDYGLNNEAQIVPSNLHPQPPRKTRSLVHLFIPAEDYDYGNKELFFENETPFSSEEGSDSLLSTSKYQLPRVDKNDKSNKVKRSESFKQVAKAANTLSKQNSLDGGYYSNGVVVTHTHEDSKKVKAKSLDRIDDGLDTLVDIVVTDHKIDKSPQTRTRSDVVNNQRKLNGYDDKMKMFLPKRDRNDILYYFPRVQERKSNSFLVNRGHANAGLYSGQVVRENSSNVAKKKEFVSGNNRHVGKVTDLPSGLY
ncbi:hypothetical protein Zmor_022214 [Zophobas morio]|uniref:GBD/FH3 domain-containing protein n=1 Tax=Zophobas morio TaxID=2755281 RepID=A0AA38I0S5_9CUCU|nr:hypothetical protein Zmor_022214 [Zophobas morio]